MQKIMARAERPDHIIIETSGLALPQPLVRAFNWPEVKAQITVDGVLTLVDGKALSEGRFATDEEALAAQRAADPTVDHENPIEELFEDQINAADMLIINKTDLLSDGELDGVETELRSLARKSTRLVRSTQGNVDLAVLLGLGAMAEDDMQNRPSHHEMEGEEQHDHDDFVTFIVSLPGELSQSELTRRIKVTIEAHDILRLKGFANIAGSASRLLVQAVGPRLNSYFDRPWHPDEKRKTEIVVIGEKHMDRVAITASLGG